MVDSVDRAMRHQGERVTMPRTTEHNVRYHHIGIGYRGRKRMNHSEVCIHMGIAGQYLDFAVIDGSGGRGTVPNPFVQLFVITPERFTQVFSAPITQGEAGLFDTHRGESELPCYYYPHEMDDELDPVASMPPVLDTHDTDVIPLEQAA